MEGNDSRMLSLREVESTNTFTVKMVNSFDLVNKTVISARLKVLALVKVLYPRKGKVVFLIYHWAFSAFGNCYTTLFLINILLLFSTIT